jgi:hypothetical protein
MERAGEKVEVCPKILVNFRDVCPDLSDEHLHDGSAINHKKRNTASSRQGCASPWIIVEVEI